MSYTIDLEAQKPSSNSPSSPFGSDVHLWHNPPQPTNKFSYDPDNRYPEDPIGRELGENARVWRYYRDEAAKYDQERVSRWNDIIDVLLVFAALFSSILTAFLAQTSVNLSPDYQEISARLLGEMLDRLNGGVPAAGVVSAIDLKTFAPKTADIWVNALWFTSLALSLSVAFFCVLFRQWLQHYTSGTTETLRTEAFIRQFRIMGTKQWKVSFMIALMPVMLNASLFLFLIGLDIYLWNLSWPIAAVVLGITALASLLGVIANFLPIIYPQCPYVTPVSALLYWSYRLLFPRANSEDPESGGGKNTALKLSPDTLFRRRELAQVKATTAQLCAESLAWLYGENASNPAIASVVIEALAGIKAGKGGSQVLRKDFIDVDLGALKDHEMDKHAVKVLKQHAMSSDNLHDAKMILEGKGEDNVSRRLWKGCQVLDGKIVEERIRKARDRLAHLETNMEKTKAAIWTAVAVEGMKADVAKRRASSSEPV